jgi:hypothetical protein
MFISKDCKRCNSMQKANRKIRNTQKTWSTFIYFRLSRWFTFNVFLSLGPCTVRIWAVLPTFREYMMLPSSPFPQGSVETRMYIFSDTHTLPISTLKMEAICTSEMSVILHFLTERRSKNQHTEHLCLKNLKGYLNSRCH